MSNSNATFMAKLYARHHVEDAGVQFREFGVDTKFNIRQFNALSTLWYLGRAQG